MLKSWSIENFKPIVNSGELKLAPVTILAGRNSSGKSSLIQSILMIAQTLSNQVPDRALLPNERIVQLGPFENILNANSDSRTLKVTFELEIEQEQPKLLSKSERDSVDTRLNIKSAKVTISFSDGTNNGANHSAIQALKVRVENVSLEIDFTFRFVNSGIKFLDKDSNEYLNIYVKRLANSDAEKFLENVAPDFLRLISYNSGQPNYSGCLEASSDEPDEVPSEPYLVELSHFLPTRLIRKKEIGNNIRGLEVINNDSIYTLNYTNEQITNFFASKIRYLSPLRTDPDVTQKAFAPTSELDDVGPKGEYAAVVYHYNQLASIKWYNPQTKQVERGTLQEALDGWVQYLGIAAQVRTEMAGGLGVSWQVTIKGGQKARALPEVGGGVSHVLPILVMGLLAPENTLLIIEEPEVTLHARVQALLGDFFIGLSKCKKQCLIETHSENLVSQLRFHIVQSGGQEESGCMIYFVEQDEKGAAQFEPIEISARGNIMNWPTGFFDETMHQEDRINAASIRRRARLAKNG